MFPWVNTIYISKIYIVLTHDVSSLLFSTHELPFYI